MKKLLYLFISICFITSILYGENNKSIISKDYIGFERTFFHPDTNVINGIIDFKFMSFGNNPYANVRNMKGEGQWFIDNTDGDAIFLDCSYYKPFKNIAKNEFWSLTWADEKICKEYALEENGIFANTWTDYDLIKTEDKLKLYDISYFSPAVFNSICLEGQTYNLELINKINKNAAFTQYGKAIVSDIKFIARLEGSFNTYPIGNPYLLDVPIDNIKIEPYDYVKIYLYKDHLYSPNKLELCYRPENYNGNNNKAGWYESSDDKCLNKVTDAKLLVNGIIWVSSEGNELNKFPKSNIYIIIKSPYSKKIQGCNLNKYAVETEFFSTTEIEK